MLNSNLLLLRLFRLSTGFSELGSCIHHIWKCIFKQQAEDGRNLCFCKSKNIIISKNREHRKKSLYRLSQMLHSMCPSFTAGLVPLLSPCSPSRNLWCFSSWKVRLNERVTAPCPGYHTFPLLRRWGHRRGLGCKA